MHAVSDAVDENRSALQAYLSIDGAQDHELCALLSVLQISTLLVLQYLLLVVQPVMHILWGFPRSERACLPPLDAMLPQDVTARRDFSATAVSLPPIQMMFSRVAQSLCLHARF